MEKATHGARRRRSIVQAAVDLSTVEGLAGLSLQRIADVVGLTKPGVAAHFDSKEALQLTAVEWAAAAYAGPLTKARGQAPPGLARLRALVEAWLLYLASAPYQGGCFFASAGHDYSGRPGPVRDAIARHTRQFVEALDEEAQLAARLGELRADVSPSALAFTLHGLALEANLRRELLGERKAFELARQGLDTILRGVVVAASPRRARR